MALPNAFSFVTVMDVEVRDFASPHAFVTDVAETSTITCLTVSSITQEGPRKEARGGKNAEPCIRYGKTLRIEMEDVVARPALFEYLFGVDTTGGTYKFTNEFAKNLRLVGKTQVVDKDTGNLVDATITIYNFLPDSVTDFTMEAEGDVGVINIAGELFPDEETGLFYTIV